MFSWLKWKKKDPKPVKRGCYFVNTGNHVGCFVLFLPEKSTKGLVAALMMPDNKPELIPDKDVKYALESGLLEFVKKVPRYVYKTCLKEYDYRRQLAERETVTAYEKYDSRRKQLNPQSDVDRKDSTRGGGP